MKEYKRTQKVKAIQCTGLNNIEIENALGHWDFDILTDFKSDLIDYCLLLREIKTETWMRVYKNEWVVIDNFHLYSQKIFIVSDLRFKEEFAEVKKKIKNEKNKTPKKI